MKNKKQKKKKQAIPSTQKNVAISEIKNDTIIMRDGTLRSVLMVSSINFALKNEDEQNAIISSYVSFLNSIDHPLQVVIQSRELNIEPYIKNLAEKEREQTNELLRAQMADYRSFVASLVEMGEIMSKSFYVVVPYDPLSDKKKGFFSRLGEVLNPVKIVRIKEERFLRRKAELETRVRLVESGLTSMGLSVVQLDTQSLIELMYSTYNPDIALSEPMPDLNELQVEKMR